MLLTWLTVQLGSTGMLPPGCGGVQKAVHINVGGVTRMFHPRKKHLPELALEALTMDVMTMPLFSSTKRFAAPTPVYWPPGLFPSTVPMPLKTEKLSRNLPFRAFTA